MHILNKINKDKIIYQNNFVVFEPQGETVLVYEETITGFSNKRYLSREDARRLWRKKRREGFKVVDLEGFKEWREYAEEKRYDWMTDALP